MNQTLANPGAIFMAVLPCFTVMVQEGHEITAVELARACGIQLEQVKVVEVKGQSDTLGSLHDPVNALCNQIELSRRKQA